MRLAVGLGSLGFNAGSARKRSLGMRWVARWVRRLSRLPFEPLEVTLGRAIDRAFAEFAREMRG